MLDAGLDRKSRIEDFGAEPVPNRDFLLSAVDTVTCRNGHSRTVTVDQLATLDHWLDAAGEELSVAV